MTLPLPDPYTTLDSGNVDASGVQRNFETLSQVFPLGPQHLRNSSATGGGAATKLHTTTPTTSSPATTSTTPVALAQMSVTADFGGNPVQAMFTGEFANNTSGHFVSIVLFDAGVQLGNTNRLEHVAAANQSVTLALIHAYTPAAGSRTLDIRWFVSGGTATNNLLRRQLSILELRS